jgi:hypothetical protein
MSRKKKMDRLSARAAAARAEGISYGQWIAKHCPPGTEQEAAPAKKRNNRPVITKTCPHCGTTFQTTNRVKIYCTPDCGESARSKRKWEDKKAKRAKEEIHC